MGRLEAAWQEQQQRRGSPDGSADGEAAAAMPVPVECALAQYCVHCITKMNANMGFGTHMPGMGRQPVPAHEVERHIRQLASAISAAVKRDFPDELPAEASPLGALDEEQIRHVCQVHLRGLFLYQQELGNALACANRDGEEARRVERKRIWGYE